MENGAGGVWRPKSAGQTHMQEALGSGDRRRLLSNKLAAGFAASGVAPRRGLELDKKNSVVVYRHLAI